MKYIENNDQLGIMAADSDIANMIMENLGYDSEPEEATNLLSLKTSLLTMKGMLTLL